MGHVDDVNCLVPIEDVRLFMEKFEEYGEPLGAVMNRDKTRIMTSTHGRKLAPLIRRRWSALFGKRKIANDLQYAIDNYSKKKSGDTSVPYEEVNGLRVLGVPVGSQQFCKDFISGIMKNASNEAVKICEGLDDLQKKLQLL